MVKGKAEIVQEYTTLHRECHALFSQLGTLPEYGAHHWQPFFTRAFAAFSHLWKFQRQHRDELMEAGALTRLRVGEIANRIGQLYGHYYTRTGNPTYLKQALSFYQSIHDRGYFNRPQASPRAEPDSTDGGTTKSAASATAATAAQSKAAKTGGPSPAKQGAENKTAAQPASTTATVAAGTTSKGAADGAGKRRYSEADGEKTGSANARKGSPIPLAEVSSAYLTVLIPPEAASPAAASDSDDEGDSHGKGESKKAKLEAKRKAVGALTANNRTSATADAQGTAATGKASGPAPPTTAADSSTTPTATTPTKVPTPLRDMGETTEVPPANPRKPTRAIINPPVLEGVWNEERVMRYYARFAVTALLLYGNCPHRAKQQQQGQPDQQQCSAKLCSLLRRIHAKVLEVASPTRAHLWRTEFDAAVAMADAINAVGFPCRRAPLELMTSFQHRTSVREVLVVDARRDQKAFSEITLNILFLMQLFEIAPGSKADDLHAHKAGLHIPEVPQLLAFASIAIRELPADSVFVLHISADATPERDALVFETDDESGRSGSTVRKLYPQDLAFMLRVPLVLIIDSPAADRFLELSMMHKHSTPLFLITGPGDWPQGWKGLFPCSCFAAFLTDPFVALKHVLETVGGKGSTTHVSRSEYARLFESFMRSLRNAQSEPVRSIFQDFFLLRLLAHAMVVKNVLHGLVNINIVGPIATQGVDTGCVAYLRNQLVTPAFQQPVPPATTILPAAPGTAPSS